jgi:hypothetical protein
MAVTFAPDLATLIPLLAAVRARKLARQSGGATDQTRAEDDTRTPATASEDAA